MNRHSYNAIVKEWDAARSTLFSHETAFLDRLLINLQPPAKILDLGCGTGRPIAEFLLRRGFRVTGVDQAEELLSLARQRYPEGRWLQSSMESFESDEDYDGAVIWDSLFHLPREHHENVLRKVVGSLRPGAKLMLTVGGSDHPAFTDTMYGHTFFYDSFTPEQTVLILQNLGASIESADFINPPTTGRDKGRYGIVASVA
ncbi:class I SAM-dependent methyltransferase [Aquabacterium sp.]|uniref:class I SAM-dependent methyltransferase n=1 Tax=Aquabacterium sp. TaxID=1872578 RepID=UPI003D6D4B58